MTRRGGAARRGATCLKRSPCKAEMFRAKSKDYEGDPCKGHDRTASGMTERLGAMDKPGGCEWWAGEQPHRYALSRF